MRKTLWIATLLGAVAFASGCSAKPESVVARTRKAAAALCQCMDRACAAPYSHALRDLAAGKAAQSASLSAKDRAELQRHQLQAADCDDRLRRQASDAK